MEWGRKRERVLSSPNKEECGHELRISKVSVIVKEEPFFLIDRTRWYCVGQYGRWLFINTSQDSVKPNIVQGFNAWMETVWLVPIPE